MPAYNLKRELTKLTAEREPRILQTITADGPCISGVIRIAANSTNRYWERHDGGDELLIVLSGEAVFSLADESGKIPTTLPIAAGDVIYMPKGVAHNAKITKDLEILFVTPAKGNVDWEESA